MSAAVERPGKLWTYDEYVRLDDDTRFEIINGKALMSPAPELSHQRWARKLFLAIERHIGSKNLGEVFFAPIDVVLDPRNVVQPDLVFVSTKNAGLLDHRGVMGTPDLVVEIVSPGTLRRDRYEKRELYAKFGVNEFWIADVANRSIEVLTLKPDGYQLHACATDKGKIQSPILTGFELEIATLG